MAHLAPQECLWCHNPGDDLATVRLKEDRDALC